MKRQRSELVYHTPKWWPFPIRIDREGNTKPGFMCIHDLENGNGMCESMVFEESTEQHSCWVELRGRWNISRPCYDKIRRCPGWAGGGWKGPKRDLCRGGDGYSGYVEIDYEDKWWKWKTHKCIYCGVVVLPYMIRWIEPKTWWFEVRYFKSRMWFVRMETWWGKKMGWWK